MSLLGRRALALALAAATIAVATTARAQDQDDWFARDKAWHFDASLGIASVSYVIATWKITDSRGVGLALAGGTTLAIGAAKEGLDSVTGGDPSWKDFTWDAIGAVAGLAIAWGMDLLLGGVNDAHPLFASPPAVRF